MRKGEIIIDLKITEIKAGRESLKKKKIKTRSWIDFERLLWARFSYQILEENYENFLFKTNPRPCFYLFLELENFAITK